MLKINTKQHAKILYKIEQNNNDLNSINENKLGLKGKFYNGKVNATMAITQYLTANPHVEAVYNYGTAGAGDDSVAGELLGVSSIVERDMDITPLGLPKFVTHADQDIYFYTSNRQNS